MHRQQMRSLVLLNAHGANVSSNMITESTLLLRKEKNE